MEDTLGFWDDSPEEIKELEARKISRLPYPKTGWKPITEPPNIRGAKWIGLDTETFDPELDDHGPGWARGKGHIVGISVAVEGAKWYFPMRHEIEQENNLDPGNVLLWANWALNGEGSTIIGAKLDYDIGWLKHEGVTIRRDNKTFDAQFAEALINETSDLGLEELGWKYLDKGKNTDLLQEWCLAAYKSAKTKWRKNIYRCPPSLVGPYAEDDADMPVHILRKQWPALVQNGLVDLFEMECRLIRLFVDMRFQGIQVDIAHTQHLYDWFQHRSSRWMEWVQRRYDIGELNVNSNASLAKAFDKLGLSYPMTAPSDRHPDGQPSFKDDFMKTVKHPFALVVQRMKNLDKLCGTFLKSYLLEGHINSKVYCSFNQMKSDKGGTRTGRLSSDSPNLQNIPVRTKEGRMIRECFIKDIGHLMLRDYDYSQIEYRMLAHFATGAGSDELRARYNADPNLDYHKLVGAMIHDITGILLARGYIKNVNFGIVYGVGIAHLCEMLNLSLEKGKELLGQIHNAIPFAAATMEDLATEVNRTGIVKTILGRISHFDQWEPVDWKLRREPGFHPLPYDAARHEWGMDIMRAYLYRALNYKLQGSAADILKKGLDICYTTGVFDEIGVPRLQVHDELLFSDPGHTRDDAWKEMAHIMETCIPVKVPIRFDYSHGDNWRVAH